LLLLLIVPGVLFWSCFGGFVFIEHSRTTKALKEADADYAAGRHEQAVAAYKSYFSSAPNQPTILKRIVDHEAGKGNEAAAREWIGKGIDKKLEVTYDGPAASMYAEVKKAREEEAARERMIQQAGDSKDARAMAVVFVKKALRFPDGAEVEPKGWEQQGDLSWKVDGQLLAKNGFGVRGRNHFLVHMKKVSAEDWILLDLKIVPE
jgi:hypothetical protein